MKTLKKLCKTSLILCLITSFLAPIPQARAQGYLNLPEPGQMVPLSSSFEPVLMKGLIVHPDNPLLFDFLIDTGEGASRHGGTVPLRQEGEKLIKYFLASLAIPEQDLWVNLSPYEKDRTIPEALSQTDMGRDLLEQDYILKQVTASLIYPEKQLGKTFWDKVYAQAQQLYGTTEIPVNTFNKVWIVADRAEVYEQNNAVFVVDQHLKVMLEEDYLALQKNSPPFMGGVRGGQSSGNEPLPNPPHKGEGNTFSSQITREIILPALETEVNKGKNFAQLRQIYNSLILASWYKNNLKEVLLNQVYANQRKIKGIDLEDKKVKEEIYQQYLRAYKKGVFNYIKEDASTPDGRSARVPRKYFSGGLQPGVAAHPKRTFDVRKLDSAMASVSELQDFRVNLGLTQIKDDADDAMTSAPEPYVRTVISYQKKKGGIPQIRISEIFELKVGAKEEQVLLDAIKNDGDLFLLNKETLKLARYGTVDIVLNEKMGIIPKKYLGKKVVLSQNVMELFKSFQAEPVPSGIQNSPEVSVKVGGFFRIKIFDKKSDDSLYLVTLNGADLNEGRFKISPVGGGYQFLPGGLELYKTKISMLRTMPGEKPEDIRVIIPGSRWGSFLELVSSAIGRETYPLRELKEELNGEIGIFPTLPEHWKGPKRVVAAQVVKSPIQHEATPRSLGGIDLNPTYMQMNVQKHGAQVQLRFDTAMIEHIKQQGFDALEFEIKSINPVPNFLNLFNPA